jgi:hypothetical protein
MLVEVIEEEVRGERDIVSTTRTMKIARQI